MFLLIRGLSHLVRYVDDTLHSTMFLLIPISFRKRMRRQHSLHSTMFLLIHKDIKKYDRQQFTFTFHNVSINTRQRNLQVPGNRYPFTFHNVSINTKGNALYRGTECPLHSTMFLLIRASAEASESTVFPTLHSTMFLLIPPCTEIYAGTGSFTFHNVSINTGKTVSILLRACFFTFHNVSINT